MKTLATSLANHLLAENTKLATFWKITRQDNLVQGFTNYDQNITIDGVIYKAATGFNATAFSQDNTLAVRNLDIESVLSSDGITEADLAGGKYDYARVDVFLCRWDIPPSSLSLNPPEHILMVRGIIGEVSMSNRRYKAEVRSFAQLLQQKLSTVTTKECRAVFGDAKCTKDLSTLTDNLTVIAVTDKRQFTVNTGRANGFYNLGEITFTNGNNNGIKAMVLSHSSGVIQLFESLPYSLAIGNTLTAVAGCNKTIDACKSFNNILNYQGEPHIPGEDKFLSGFEG
ncbi:MAG: DUF2163 domain-containing protein [Candidatus Nanopelagicaceae bacterium]